MHYEQHCSDSGPEGHPADRLPSLLAGFVDLIQADQAVLVLENEHRQLEADAVVFALILAVLAFIPLVAHFVYTQSNTYFITHARPGSRPDEVGCTKKPWDFADNYTLEAQNGN